MIEFKGAYYQNRKTPSQAVLVQFDGVLLHIWHMANPFHRVLTSDVFQIGKGKRCIKLPNGSKIETDDLRAVVLLQSNVKHFISEGKFEEFSLQQIIAGLFGLAAAAFSTFFIYWLVIN